MQQTLLIIVIEFLLLLLLALIALLWLNWRKKTRRDAALEQLLIDVKDKHGLRADKIVAFFSQRYKLDKILAKELSDELFDAEKVFLMQFIEQQMLESVDGFYDNLCQLLDEYLKVLPENLLDDSAKAETVEKKPAHPVEPRANAESDGETHAEPPPDWGDVFD